jgi:hypothetical protein
MGKVFENQETTDRAKTIQIYLQGDLMQNQVVKVMVSEQLAHNKEK